MEEVPVQQEIPQKKGFWKILVWVVIVLVVLAAIFVVYKYIFQPRSSFDDKMGGDNTLAGVNDNSQSQTFDEAGNEKPPMPPE